MRLRSATVSVSALARRQEIGRTLRAIAAAGGRPRLRIVGESGGDESLPLLLRDGLGSLGGMFRLFGRYLADRRDLLPPPFALALAEIEDWASPLASRAIHGLIADRLGGAATNVVSLDDDAIESRVAWQAHRAVLTDGHAVLIRVSRPALAEDIEHADLLYAFVEAIAPGKRTLDAFHAAAADFLDEFRDNVDLRSEQDALTALAQETRALDCVAAPRLRPSLCGPGVLTFEPVGRSPRAQPPTPFGTEPDTGAARRIAVAWLELATLAGVFPAVVAHDGIACEGARRIAFSSGPFHVMPAAAQASLREYVLHARTDPDRACAAFLRQMRGEVAPEARHELTRHFRQAVPFRDSEWCCAGEDEGYEHYLWVHGRRATAVGCVPLPHMAAVHRGITSLVRTIRPLAAPGSDPLGEAVEELCGAQTMRDVAAAVDPAEVLRVTREYLQVAMLLPERMEEMMGRISDGGLPMRVSAPDGSRAGRPSRMWLFAIVLLCVVLSDGSGTPTSAVLVKALLIAAFTMAVASVNER